MLAIGQAVDAYNQNVHLQLTRFLAVAAGIAPKAAAEIAVADNDLDNPEYSAESNEPNSRAWHFVSARRLAELRQHAFDACDTTSIGRYFHAYQDAFSHEGYEPVLGHLHHLHHPDEAFRDISKAQQMAEGTIREMLGVGAACPALLASNVQRKTWRDVAQTVEAFLRARGPAQLPEI